MLEPNRSNYLEFEQPAADGAGRRSMSSDRSLYLEIEGQDRIYTGATSARLSFLLRKHVPESLARRYQVLPIEMKQGVLKVAMVDPENHQLLRDLQREVGAGVQIQAYRTTAERIQQGLAMYRNDDIAAPIVLRSHPPPVLQTWMHASHRSPARGRRAAFWIGGGIAVGLLMLGALYMFYLVLIHHWVPLAH